MYSVGERMRRRLAAAGVEVRFKFDHFALEDAVSDALAWICREATTNVLKHSNARRAWLELAGKSGGAVLRIRDDGVGISTPELPDQELHMGLHVMRERAEEVGGVVKISSPDGRGVRVECRVPRPVVAGRKPARRRTSSV